MQKIKIFLAASIELEDEIIRLGDAIRYKNNLLAEKGIYFELKTWRDHSSRMVKEGLQHEYNESVKEGDIFLLLAHTKVGEFTEMEFENAYQNFIPNSSPQIFTYFKTLSDQEPEQSLTAFRNKLMGINHYLSGYADFNDLWNKVNKELDHLLDHSPNFSLLTHPDLFNSLLTRRILEAVGRNNLEVEEKLKKLNKANPNWENDKRYIDGAKGYITELFSGILGAQIGKLMAIGKSADTGQKAENYIRQCHQIARICFQISAFSLLSKLWANLSKGIALDKKLSAAQNQILAGFFEGEEVDSQAFFQLIGILLPTFLENNIDLPIPELAEIQEEFQSESTLELAVNELDKLSQSKTASYTQCFLAEQQLSFILDKMIFFTQYKMISIKTVNYETVFERSEGFFHNYAKVGGKASQTTTAESLNYHQMPIQNHAVLLYKTNYTDESQCVNLYPFIVDMHSLTLEPGNKICFFSQKQGIQNILSYRFVETNEVAHIAFKGLIPATNAQNLPEVINKIIADKSQRIQLNLDNTVRLFAHAAKTLAGVHVDLESEDIFSF
ncbi:hypothetical protein [Cyclobacterium amurskyense]|uniref:hypothetical protein n=1 Tax=Cyclobacterium amurskyense TaxID=320787 RepID=UPI0030DB2374|tara:strand:+ start:2386 stop:4053 length:1668 start_codon:yes stop_codon:yes gene_type:complete